MLSSLFDSKLKQFLLVVLVAVAVAVYFYISRLQSELIVFGSNLKVSTATQKKQSEKIKELREKLTTVINENSTCNDTLKKTAEYYVKSQKTLKEYRRRVKDAKNTKVDTLSDFVNYAEQLQ